MRARKAGDKTRSNRMIGTIPRLPGAPRKASQAKRNARHRISPVLQGPTSILERPGSARPAAMSSMARSSSTGGRTGCGIGELS
jgi:hypothetical protein